MTDFGWHAFCVHRESLPYEATAWEAEITVVVARRLREEGLLLPAPDPGIQPRLPSATTGPVVSARVDISLCFALSMPAALEIRVRR